MNKSEVVRAVAAATGLTQKQAAAAVEAFLDGIQSALKAGQVVQLTEFGSFEVKTCAARKGTRPGTHLPLQIPERRAVSFRASKSLRAKVR
jgi:DNA-binding protein HU-beta